MMPDVKFKVTGTILMQQVQCRKITGEKKMGNGIIMMRMGIW